MKLNRCFILLLLFFFVFSSLCFASATNNIPVWSSTAKPIENTNNVSKDNLATSLSIDNSTVSSISNSITNSSIDNSIVATASTPDSTNLLNIESESAILLEQTTGKILYEHNSHEQLRPASVTKVMTVLLIMEALDSGKISLEDSVPCSETASAMGGSQIWLDPTETLTVHEMLKAICVVSANDCTVAMAEHLAGSQEAFVELMNKRAKELGMNDTSFKNCHGLDEDGHLTSSHDIALMSKELLQNHPTIKNYTTIWMDSLRNGESELVNTNKLIRNYEGATGLKTGSTSLALYNLSASATRNGLSLIAVIMKGPTSAIRFADSQKLLNYGFSNYCFKSFGNKGDIVKSINVEKGISTSVDCILEETTGAVISKTDEKNIEQIIKIPDKVFAPITEGDVLGQIEYSLNGEVVSSVSVVAKESIKKLSFWNTCSHLLQNLLIK